MHTSDTLTSHPGTPYDRVLAVTAWRDVVITDREGRLSIAPRGAPGWYWACAYGPFLLNAVTAPFALRIHPDRLWTVLVTATMTGMTAFIIGASTLRWNRKMGAGKPTAVFDRTARALFLCDAGMTLQAGWISTLQLVTQMKKAKESDGKASLRVTGLFVLATLPDGTTVDEVIAMARKPDDVRRFAEELSKGIGVAFDVEDKSHP